MYYAMSDLHGKYEKYIAMLEKINFSDEDTMFVIGDVVDRGEKPVEILLDMMKRPNVYPIMGNHEALALYILKKLTVEITEENSDSQINAETMNELIDWISDGGSPTISGFQKLKNSERLDLLDYISEFPMYEVTDVGERTFIMVHAGLGNFRKGKKLREYTLEELIMTRNDFGTKYFDDDNIYVVTGHTPTLAITGKPQIYHKNNNICIDCGASYEGGKLACLCLDNMKEYYV